VCLHDISLSWALPPFKSRDSNRRPSGAQSRLPCNPTSIQLLSNLVVNLRIKPRHSNPDAHRKDILVIRPPKVSLTILVINIASSFSTLQRGVKSTTYIIETQLYMVIPKNLSVTNLFANHDGKNVQQLRKHLGFGRQLQHD